MGGRFGELLLILFIVLILFGPGKIPKIMADIGKGIKSLRDNLQNKTPDKEDENGKSVD